MNPIRSDQEQDTLRAHLARNPRSRAAKLREFIMDAARKEGAVTAADMRARFFVAYGLLPPQAAGTAILTLVRDQKLVRLRRPSGSSVYVYPHHYAFKRLSAEFARLDGSPNP